MGYRSILVLAEESQSGTRALRAGAAVAAAAHAGLAALRLVDEPWPFVEPGEVEAKRALRSGAWQRVAQHRVGDELRRLAAELPPGLQGFTPMVRFGPPAVEIPHAAEAVGADLIVFGTAPAGIIDDVILRTRLPCLIVPPDWRGWSRLVVVGEAYREAFAFADLFHSDVVVVDHEPQLAETAANKAFAVWAKLPGTGAFDLVVHQGDAATRALEAARAERADVLVLPYARGPAAAAAVEVARRATCAVLLVPV
jgi:nucleotide-binding universal stress UspA family protein